MKNTISKIKLSDWIAFASFIIALIALLNTCSPKKAKIEVVKLSDFITTTRVDTMNQTNVVLRFNLRNNGEKEVTIERLLKSEEDSGILGYDKLGEQRNIERFISLKYINKHLDSKYYFEKEMDTLKIIFINDGLSLNKEIGLGESKELNLLFVNYGRYLKILKV